MRNIFAIIVVLLTICHCSTADKTAVEKINFGDTLYQSQAIRLDNGDTIYHRLTTWFAPTDASIDTSCFFYEGSNKQNEGTYRIYFNRQQVVAFCDSMLQVIPPYRNQGDDTIFFQRNTYEHIKAQAAANKMAEAIYAGETAILLARFNPLIVNRTTGHRPSYIIIQHEDNGPGGAYTSYMCKAKHGDTVGLGTAIVRPMELQLEEDHHRHQ